MPAYNKNQQLNYFSSLLIVQNSTSGLLQILSCDWRYTMTMTRILFIILCLFGLISCSKTISVDYTLMYLIESPLFKLQIAPTFASPFEYEVDRHAKRLTLRRYKGKGGYNWGEIASVESVELTDGQFNRLTSMINGVLETIPTNDQSSGPDGDTWIIESGSAQYLKVAVWEPLEDMENRGYGKLVKLHEKMAKYFKL